MGIDRENDIANRLALVFSSSVVSLAHNQKFILPPVDLAGFSQYSTVNNTVRSPKVNDLMVIFNSLR